MGEWSQIIASHCAKEEQIFALAPKRFVPVAREETAIQKNYNGRQILEVIQNAADATDGSPVRVHIELRGNILYIANTGRPFTIGGFESLVISHNSEKRFDRNRNIGNRGLGFRSLLNWTHSPAILSGSLRLGFSKGHAERGVDTLCARYPELGSVVARELDAGLPKPVPVLAFPIDLVEQLAEWLDEVSALQAISHADTLRTSGFTTVVMLPLSEGVEPKVREQVLGLEEEIGLFIPSLGEVTTVLDGTARTIRTDREGSRVTIVIDGAAFSTWDVYRESDEIPPNVLSEGEPRGLRYEVAVAVRTDGPSEEAATLWCYLPTAVQTHLPVRLHATLDLRDERETLRAPNSENTWVLERLARKLIQVAIERRNDTSPWHAFDLLTPRQSLDPQLEELGFSAKLDELTRTAEVIPLRHGWTTPRGARALFSKKDHGSWLPEGRFQDIVLWTQDKHIIARLRSMEPEPITPSALADMLETEAAALQPVEIARIILGHIDDPSVRTNPPAALLLDAARRLPPRETKAYLPSDNVPPHVFPTWSSVHFVDPAIASELAKGLNAPPRELAAKVRPFPLHDFSLQDIASALADDHLHLQPPTQEGTHELAAILFRLWKRMQSPGKSYLAVRLVADDGVPRYARSLHFSAACGRGQLCAALLKKRGPDSFVSHSAIPAEGATTEEIESFLQWLGVSDVPRASRKDVDYPMPKNEFANYFLDKNGGAATFGGYTYPTSGSIKFENQLYLEDLPAILELAEPEAIIAWLAREKRTSGSELIEALHGKDPQARVELYIRKYHPMTKGVPASYIAFQLRSTPWIPVRGGGKRTPPECITSADADDALAAFLDVPVLDYSHPLLVANGIERADVDEILHRLDASQTIEALGASDLYAHLKRVPTRLGHANASELTSVMNTLVGQLTRRGERAAVEPDWAFKHERCLPCFGPDRPHFVNALNAAYAPDARIRNALAGRANILCLSEGSPDKVSRALGCQTVEVENLLWTPSKGKGHATFAQLPKRFRDSKPELLRYLNATGKKDAAAKLARLDLAIYEELAATTQYGSHRIEVEWRRNDGHLFHESSIHLLAGTKAKESNDPDVLGRARTAIYARIGLDEDGSFDAILRVALIPGKGADVLAHLVDSYITPPAADVADEVEPPSAPPATSRATGGATTIPVATPQEATAPAAVPDSASPSPSTAPAATVESTGMEAKAEVIVPDSAPEAAENEGRVQPDADPTIVSVTVKDEGPLTPRTSDHPATNPTAPPRGLLDERAADEDEDEVDEPEPSRSGGGRGPKKRRKGGVRRWRRIKSTIAGAPSGRIRSGKTQESVVVHYEISQGRFPWPRASEYAEFGCDILSFASEQDRTDFETRVNAGGLDFSTVVRFIEVKGRGRATEVVFLRSNQIQAAKKYGERYWAYVVRPAESPDETEIVEISNPAEQFSDVPGLVLARSRATVHVVRTHSANTS